jgi:hypothetical protein
MFEIMLSGQGIIQKNLKRLKLHYIKTLILGRIIKTALAEK